ncbi:MAG: hypothetical protein K0R29_1399 [Pseudobdellovibrio sp.]|jgi:hypothetical protein|nr:hypothetical protein [Pseudobdellovibrio sp.]
MSKLKLLQIIQLKKFGLSVRLALYFILFVAVFLNEKAKVLSYPDPLPVLDNLPVTDCGVVLTGAPGRIREAFEVFTQRKFKKLVISGVYKDTQLHEIFPQLPFYPEVNPDDVILEKISGSTYANAVQSLLVSETLKCKSILLMTSEIHMYRALHTFKAVFPDTIKIVQYPISSGGRESRLFDVYFETFKTIFYDIAIIVTTLIK